MPDTSTNQKESIVIGSSQRTSKFAVFASMLAFSFLPQFAHAQSGLNVVYGTKGVQAISFNGVRLEDTNAFPADAFHIWHMKTTDLNGNVWPVGQYGWGETNSGERWDAQAQTETYTFSWGSIAVHFQQNGNNLDMTVTETNNANSGVVLDGAEVYPFALHFPQEPAGFGGYTQYAITEQGPGVSTADFGSGVVTSVIPNESLSLYGGWKAAGTNTYTPLMTATAPDGLASFLPSLDQPVQPGSSLSFTVSLRFTPEGAPVDAADAYASYAATYPSQMSWTDHRIIGTAYLASSPSGSNINQPGGYPTNPRRYFNDPSIDITSPRGLQIFQDRMLTQAASNVTNSRAMNAQGVVTWDIEGEQYPQNTTYVCSPDQIGAVAPEMESTVLDQGSPYYGQRLDDAYFRTMTSAGLRVGVCLRPQVFTLNGDGSAAQIFLTTNQSIIANLENKARFANARWGATMFYVDSSVNPQGGALDPAIFQQLITDFPAFLFIPEESTPRYYAYSAPFYSFIFHQTTGTPASTYSFYPNAFGATLVNDVSAGTLAAYIPQLTQSVSKGDILMGHADYFQANDPTLISIYAAAGFSPAAPISVTPHVSWPAPAAIGYGTQLSAAQLDASATVPGTFTYSPAAGTVLPAGSQTLTAIFTPADQKDYSAVTSTTTLAVSQATPVLTWPAPQAIAAGTSLSGQQLNANANVAGSFSYYPGPGAVLPVGSNTLTVTFTPQDGTDYAAITASVSLVVNQASQSTPQLSWNAPGQITFGTGLSGAQLNASANVGGSFSYNPSPGTVLPAGRTLLQVTFTPYDQVNYAAATASTVINVAQATPQIFWAAPAPITAGTALSAAQLNASANVAGTFSYTPGAGSVPAAGVSLLQVFFTPADGNDYTTQTASVPLTVNAAAPAQTQGSNLLLLSPAPGTTVSGSIQVQGLCNLFLDAAGTYLMVDGQEIGDRRYFGIQISYPLDTTTLSNGPHLLQLRGHDIGNNTTITAPVTINVQN